MKKIVSIVLALVLVLAIAAPAMAITGYVSPVTQKTASAPWALELDLVSDDAAGLGILGLSAPIANKAYVMNEVIYGRINVAGNPKTTWNVYDYKDTNLVISSNAAVLLNAIVYEISSGASDVLLSGASGAVTKVGEAKANAKNIISMNLGSVPTNVVVLFSGVVQAQGSIVAELMGGNTEYFEGIDGELPAIPLGGTEDFAYICNDLGVFVYRVCERVWDAKSNSIYVDIYDAKGETIIGQVEFNRNEKNACTAISVFVTAENANKGLAVPATKYVFGKNMPISTGAVADVFTIDGGAILCSSLSTDAAEAATYKTLRGLYDQVMSFFGFDFDAKGELLDAHITSKLHSFYAKDEVAVNLYTAAITVPDADVEIPQTGDAATVIGFVMVAMAIVAAAAVAYRKVRA